MGLSYSEAASFRGEMTEIAGAAGDMAINSKDIVTAFMAINDALGAASTTLARDFGEIVEQTAVLQKKMG